RRWPQGDLREFSAKPSPVCYHRARFPLRGVSMTTWRAGRLWVLLVVASLAGTVALAGRQGAEPPTGTAAAAPGDWLQLFNGRDLTGWTPKFAKHDLGVNLNDTVRAEDGLLKIRYDKWTTFDGEFGHIFYERPFSYYVLAAEYRFVEEQVAGGP